MNTDFESVRRALESRLQAVSKEQDEAAYQAYTGNPAAKEKAKVLTEQSVQIEKELNDLIEKQSSEVKFERRRVHESHIKVIRDRAKQMTDHLKKRETLGAKLIAAIGEVEKVYQEFEKERDLASKACPTIQNDRLREAFGTTWQTTAHIKTAIAAGLIKAGFRQVMEQYTHVRPQDLKWTLEGALEDDRIRMMELIERDIELQSQDFFNLRENR